MDIIFTEDLDDVRYDPVFSAAEVQQLREVLKTQLNTLENDVKYYAHLAKKWKYVNPVVADERWKEHFKTKAKIKKIAALQSKMKKFDVLY